MMEEEFDAVTRQAMGMLEHLGLHFPGRIDEEERPFPVDLTEVSMVELGELHSYYTAQFARATTLHGVMVARKRSLRFELSRIRSGAEQLGGGDQIDVRRLQTEAEFARVDAAEVMLAGITDAHKRYADACSRELTRRQVEASMNY